MSADDTLLAMAAHWHVLIARHRQDRAADIEEGALLDRILATRATTPAGMLAKLELWPHERDSMEGTTASVYADLQALVTSG